MKENKTVSTNVTSSASASSSNVSLSQSPSNQSLSVKTDSAVTSLQDKIKAI
tara:strand:+ start:1026 stop:1181 length:156 start_codon:yes stop_codon:yes gene_type:complete